MMSRHFPSLARLGEATLQSITASYPTPLSRPSGPIGMAAFGATYGGLDRLKAFFSHGGVKAIFSSSAAIYKVSPLWHFTCVSAIDL